MRVSPARLVIQSVICEQLARALDMREYKLVVFGSDGCGKSGWISKLEAHTQCTQDYLLPIAFMATAKPPNYIHN